MNLQLLDKIYLKPEISQVIKGKKHVNTFFLCNVKSFDSSEAPSNSNHHCIIYSNICKKEDRRHEAT